MGLVNTISMKLNVRIEEADVKDGVIVMSGFAGAMPCETIVAADEAAYMIKLCLKPAKSATTKIKPQISSRKPRQQCRIRGAATFWWWRPTEFSEAARP